jgi:hypothetical protein
VGTGGDGGDEVFACLGGVGLEVGFVHGLMVMSNGIARTDDWGIKPSLNSNSSQSKRKSLPIHQFQKTLALARH